MRVTLMHNPEAGDEAHSRDILVRWIADAGHQVEYQSTEDHDYVSALQDPADLVAIAGGDGTVKKVASHLMGRKIPIALLPLGTANNIAEALGYNRPIPELIATWSSSSLKKFDVGVITGTWGESIFLESTGFGLFPEMLSRIEHDKLEDQYDEVDERLTAAYLKLKQVLAVLESQELVVTLDNQNLSGRYLLMEAMNIGLIGPNLCLAPQADPGDGYLELVLLGEEERDVFSSVLAGDLPQKELPNVLRVASGKKLEVNLEEALVHIDSELETGVSGSIEITLKAQVLDFLVGGSS